MRILHFDTGMSFRGGQQQVLFLMRGLQTRGHQQILIAAPLSPLAERARSYPYEVAEISTRGWNTFRSVFKFRAAWKEFQPHILHLHDSRAHGFARLASAGRKAPFVVSRRVAFPIQTGFWSRLKFDRAQQRILAVSNFVKEQLVDSGLPEDRIDVVYDCVDDTVPHGASMRAEMNPGDRDFVIGSVGALEPEKGHDLLVQAMACVRKDMPQARCVLAGSGSQQAMLMRQIRDTGLSEHMRIVPSPVSLTDFLSSLDLFVYPSRFEGLGSVILLAFHCGTPVLASDAGGIPELIHDSVDGFLFPRDDAGALARSIMALALNAPRRSSAALAARNKVHQQFSIDVMTEATLQTYQRLLQESPN